MTARRIKRIGLATAMALIAVNIWTGSPLLALWLGSQVQGNSDHPEMSSVLAVVVALVVQSYLLTKALAWLGSVEQELSGQPQRRYREPPVWLRSMRAERSRYPDTPMALTTLDRILVVVFVLAVLAMQLWFFFFAGSPLGNQG